MGNKELINLGSVVREAYQFDPYKFDQRAQQRLYDLRSRKAPKNVIMGVNGMIYKQRAWSITYSGKVPREWGDKPWFHIEQDISNPDITLTEDMVNAAIDYPVADVSRVLGEKRKLTQDQLNKLVVKDSMKIPWIFNKVLEAQILMGTDSVVTTGAILLNKFTNNPAHIFKPVKE